MLIKILLSIVIAGSSITTPTYFIKNKIRENK
ncbi:hypothetical protein SDIMI_v3c03600 [Spiroplasma diminutum CUAS-1]|uniref:Uncharacterized protein n=1 Tax=Spiroplasma diminutum CUAS-1 TaxID=1276221 RepID=S5LWA0_9MOLU|nr:hypothetical protein SDIMI_v3c03600 [Spiroplasma diminutum CUAS-1]